MDGSSLLLVQELGPVGVFMSKSILCPLESVVVIPFLGAFTFHWINLSLFSTFSLLDVVHVAVAACSEEAEKEDEPSFSHIVEAVWLVPSWELTHVLMGILRLVAWLSVSWKIWIHVLLRNVCHC